MALAVAVPVKVQQHHKPQRHHHGQVVREAVAVGKTPHDGTTRLVGKLQWRQVCTRGKLRYRQHNLRQPQCQQQLDQGIHPVRGHKQRRQKHRRHRHRCPDRRLRGQWIQTER